MQQRIWLVVIVAMILVVSGCGSKSKPTTGQPQKRVVTDAYGREVGIPQEVKTIAAIGGAARIITYAGAADKLVGVTDMDKRNEPAMPYSVVNRAFASLASVGSGGGNDTVYIETLVTLAPDVIIGVTDAETIKTVAEKTGIPTIGLYPTGMFDESFYFAIELIGQIAGTAEHCAEVIAFIKGCQADLAERTKDIPDEAKPTVYAGAVSFRGAHGIEGTHGAYPPFTAINARNVVDETGIEGVFLIDKEKLLVWDPDIIFLNPTSMFLVNEDYAKNKTFYEGLTAVRTGRIYSQISYNFNWTNMEIAIANAYWAGKVIYPEQFADIDPIQKADEIFTVMLGRPYYEVLAKHGNRFEQMTIGTAD